MYDVCIVGGGAAGMSAAITAASAGKRVFIVDKNAKLGRKLYATGNGRCNITNENMNYPYVYNSSDSDYPAFLRAVMGDSADMEVEKFLRSLGIYTYTNQDGYVYPQSRQASSVVWAMSDMLRQLQVEIDFKHEITDIERENTCFCLKSKDGAITASQVVLASGGCSYPSLGGTGSGYMLAERLGHHILPVRPSLTGMTTGQVSKNLSGVRIHAHAKLMNHMNEIIRQETGELQFTEYGLSGIMIFNLSSAAGALLMNDKPAWLHVNFLQDISEKAFCDLCRENKHRTVTGMLNGLVNDKVAAYAAEQVGIDGKMQTDALSDETIHLLYHALSAARFDISGIRDFSQAQVTAGGVPLAEVWADTCMSKLVNGLYFAGEILDIDGICGGYNLTFAIMSGIRAGESIANDTNSSD